MSAHNPVEERREIVRKYDLGREDGASIDPWEDPTFEVYHKTDRYGFIQDKRIPDVKESRNRVSTNIKFLGEYLVQVRSFTEIVRDGNKKD